MRAMQLSILLSLFFFVQTGFSQTLSIKGRVFGISSTGDTSALPFASVYWVGTTKGTVSNANGFYKLDQHKSARKLSAGYVGYTSDTINIDHSTFFDFYLQVIEIKGVEILGKEQAQRIDPLSVNKQITLTEKTLKKAACCNLSESFENTPSVDVAYSDAATGTKQIQLLGLAGKYALITQELIPRIRGFNTQSGLNFIPGPWIKSIQITKGVGPVTNGFESISGQINVELKKPDEDEVLHLNGYASEGGRFEANIHAATLINKNWSNSVLLHSDVRLMEQDRNNDSFNDFPLGNQNNFIYRISYFGEKGLESQTGVQYVIDNKNAGQLSDVLNPYRINIKGDNLFVWNKTGIVFPKKSNLSIGLQTAYANFNQNAALGLKNYNISQQSIYSNFILQYNSLNDRHIIKSGLSFIHDLFGEISNFIPNMNRKESVPGLFLEYNLKFNDKWLMSSGLRWDSHNLYGSFLTPRLHLKYSPVQSTTFRMSAGRGQQTSNFINDQFSGLITSRNIIINQNPASPFLLNKEVAWNFGLNAVKTFTLDYREGSIMFDYYYTFFEHQTVADWDHRPDQLLFYSLSGQSYSHAFQVELNYELMRRFDFTMAYRYLDIKTDYKKGLLSRPLVPPHRAFINLAYETKSKFTFDFTAQWFSERRLPSTLVNPAEYRFLENAPAYFLFHGQISKTIKKQWDVYFGAENIADFTQKEAIINPTNPFSAYFDASIVYAPVFGRMIYIGFRFTIKKAPHGTFSKY